MKQYKVIDSLWHDGKRYEVGDLVAMEKPLTGVTETKPVAPTKEKGEEEGDGKSEENPVDDPGKNSAEGSKNAK